MRLLSALLAGCLTAVASLASADILIVGDSISAAYGIDKAEGWAELLAERVNEECPGMAVHNASVSGETTAGGAARLPALLERYSPAILVIELGGNDGLRGMAPAHMQSNLAAMVQQGRAAGAEPVLLGMKIPPNYGERYTELFERAFRQVADDEKVPLLPFFLDGVGGDASLMQEDGIHPLAAAQPRLLDNAWQVLAEPVHRLCDAAL